MKPLNTLLSALLLSAVFSLTSVQANDATTAVNINNASIEQLEKIKGIGSKKAQAILDYRMQHGNFESIDDLTKVKGIGSKFIDKNRAWLSAQ
jgi:competence protein ComEA